MKKTAITAVFMVAFLTVAGFAVATPGLTVETDKNVYSVGEDVQISLANNWNDYIGTGLGYYVTTPNGEIVWMTAWAQIMIMVPPGGSLDYVWDQTYQTSELGDDFEQVAPGNYVIHANYGHSRENIRIQEATEVAFETVEQGTISYYGYGTIYESTYLVIRDDAAWTDFWAVHKSGIMPTPEKPYIDFSTEMIIVAIHGTHNTNLAGIEIDGIYDYGSSWNVEVTVSSGDGMIPVCVNPYQIVKTAYSDLPVEFSETIVEL
jgi:hypothetical protein